MKDNYWYCTKNPKANWWQQDILWWKIKSLTWNNFDFKIFRDIWSQEINMIASWNIEKETKKVTNKEFYELFK